MQELVTDASLRAACHARMHSNEVSPCLGQGKRLHRADGLDDTVAILSRAAALFPMLVAGPAGILKRRRDFRPSAEPFERTLPHIEHRFRYMKNILFFNSAGRQGDHLRRYLAGAARGGIVSPPSGALSHPVSDVIDNKRSQTPR